MVVVVENLREGGSVGGKEGEVSYSLALAGQQTGRVRFSDKQLVQTMAELIVALRAIVESYKSYLHTADCVSMYVCANHLLVCRSISHTNVHNKHTNIVAVLFHLSAS